MYPPEVVEHFEHPRNTGDLPDPDVRVEAENPACGDIMRLTLKLQAGRVAEIRYKVRGCVASIAAGSALTEMINGRSREEMRSLARETLVRNLGGLTPESMHASHLAWDCLQAAIAKMGT
jgi:nitrogen fixation NifU-like protein